MRAENQRRKLEAKRRRAVAFLARTTAWRALLGRLVSTRLAMPAGAWPVRADGGTAAVVALALALGACAEIPVTVEPASGMPALPSVQPSAETAPVANADDAADDAAIWVNPADRAASRIVVAQKKYGVLLYALDGRLLQSLPVGRINNIDLRDGFVLAGKPVTLVAGSNRSDDSIALFALDPASGLLADVAAGRLASGLSDPYGLCMYRSAKDGATYVIANDKDGRVRQWRLRLEAGDKVGLELTREFRLATQPEGCVADDETGRLFLGEEDYGLWVMAAEPDGGSERTLVDRAGPAGHLIADVEGMSLWKGEGGKGWLVVSSQGEHAYAVYRREAPHAFVGKFRILDNGAKGIDGASETDGLDITSADLGGEYSRGLLIVQDGYNLMPAENQNFKLVPWAAVERLLPR